MILPKLFLDISSLAFTGFLKIFRRTSNIILPFSTRHSLIFIGLFFEKFDKAKLIYHGVYILNPMTQKNGKLISMLLRRILIQIFSIANITMLRSGSFSCYYKLLTYFINFDKKFNFQFPLWFLRLWNQFGTNSEIFLKNLNTIIIY